MNPRPPPPERVSSYPAADTYRPSPSYHHDDNHPPRRDTYDSYDRHARRDSDLRINSYRDHDRDRDRDRGAGWDRRNRDSVERTSADGRTPLSANPVALSPTLDQHRRSSLSTTITNMAAPTGQVPVEIVKPLAEATSKYHLLREAQMDLNVSEEYMRNHRGHFATYPALKERAEDRVNKALSKHKKCKEDYSRARQVADEIITGFVRDVALQTAQKFQPPERPQSAASSAEFEELRKEMRALQEREERRDKKLEGLQKQIQRQHSKLSAKIAELEKKQQDEKKSFVDLTKDVEHVQELAVKLSEAPPPPAAVDDGRLQMVQNQVNDFASRVQGIQQSLHQMQQLTAKVENFEARVNSSASELQQVREQVKAQSEGFATRPAEAAPQLQVENAAGYATAADLEALQNYVNSSVDDAVNMTAELAERVDKFIPETNQHLADQQANSQALSALIEGLRQKTEGAYAALSTTVGHHNNALESCNISIQDHGRLLAESGKRLDALDKSLNETNERVNGVQFSLNLCSTTLENWSTREWYDRLTDMIAAKNPNWYAMGAELKAVKGRMINNETAFNALRNDVLHKLQTCLTGNDKMQQAITTLQQSLEAVKSAPPPAPPIQPSPTPQQPNPTPTSTAPPPEFLEKLEDHANKIQEHTRLLTHLLEQHTIFSFTVNNLTSLPDRLTTNEQTTQTLQKEFEKHLSTFKNRMDKLTEWTQKVTVRINENARLGDDIQASLAELRGKVGYPGTPAVGGEAKAEAKGESKGEEKGIGKRIGTGSNKPTITANGSQWRVVNTMREELKPLNAPRRSESVDTNKAAGEKGGESLKQKDVGGDVEMRDNQGR